MTRILTGGTPADDRPGAVDPDAPRSRPSIRERTRQLVRIGGVLTLGGVAALATFHFGFMPIAVRHGHDVTVPKVTGLHFDDARRVLSDHGLEAQRVADRVSVEWNPGVVLEQSPTPGFHSREGRPIGLVVSLGRGEVGVPDVAGESYRHAELILTRLGLPVGRVSRTASPRPVDEVLEVSPPTGTALIRGRPVDLLLSTGTTPRAFVMPDFSGGDPEGVSRSLRREGFRAEIVYPVGSYSATGRIASHTPPPGHRVVVGDEIKLMVREGS
jgi:serine/threonine-protein kinase